MLMPLTYGFVGWLTNVVAIRMMFYPVEFRGIPPYLGWQGIVPRRASGLALKAVNTVSGKLFRIEEFFAKIPTQTLEKQFREILENNIPVIGDHLLQTLPPALLAKLGERDQKEIYEKAQKESLSKMKEILAKLEEDVGKVFNFKNLVLRSLTGANVYRIIDMFQTIGEKEFRFIALSGWYFGALLGLVQMGLWFLYPLWWTLPLQGAFVGYITNYLALTMVFRPQKPRQLGPWRYQGLFHKRRKEVSQKYAELLANYVLNGRNIMDDLLYRRIARATVEIIQQGFIQLLSQKDLEESEKEALQVYQAEREAKGRDDVILVADMLSQKAKTLEKMLDRTMAVEKTIAARLAEMPPEEFEPILRTAFQQDEWILIVTGAVLGSLVGLVQGLYMAFATTS